MHTFSSLNTKANTLKEIVIFFADMNSTDCHKVTSRKLSFLLDMIWLAAVVVYVKLIIMPN